MPSRGSMSDPVDVHPALSGPAAHTTASDPVGGGDGPATNTPDMDTPGTAVANAAGHPAFDATAFADRCGAAADRLRDSFRARFVSPDRPWLADVVDGPDGDDWSHRPNQVLALSLAADLVDGETADRVLAAVARSLVTSMGLRTLSRDNAAYRGTYGGDRRIRDGAYHQGTVWPWLMGPYLEALWRRTGERGVPDEERRDLVLSYLEPFADHLRDHGLGTVAEIADGDPPYRPNGATSQAWSIAELLRVWHQARPDGVGSRERR